MQACAEQLRYAISNMLTSILYAIRPGHNNGISS